MSDYEKEVQKNKEFVVFYELYKEMKQIPEVQNFDQIENEQRLDALQLFKSKIINSLGKLDKRRVEGQYINFKTIDREPLTKSEDSKLKVENTSKILTQIPVEIENEREKPVEIPVINKEKVELMPEVPLVIELHQEIRVKPLEKIIENSSEVLTPVKCKMPYSPLDFFEDDAKEKVDRKNKDKDKIKVFTKTAIHPLLGIQDKRLLFPSTIAMIKVETPLKKIEEIPAKPVFPNKSTDKSEFMANLLSYYSCLGKKYPKAYLGKFIHFEGSKINGIRNLNYASEMNAYPCKPFTKLETIDYDIESEDEFSKHYPPVITSQEVEREPEQMEVEEECIQVNQERDSDSSSMQLSENESSMNDDGQELEIIDQNSNPPPNESSQTNINQVDINDPSKLLKPRFTVKLNDKDLPNSTRSDSSAILDGSELDKYIFDIIRLIHYSFENSKSALKEKVMNEFKPKRKDLETFFNANVIKSKCEQTQEVSLLNISS